MAGEQDWASWQDFGDLLRRARQGDREALGEILGAFRHVLLHQIRRQIPRELRSRCAPSDLVQDTLLEAHRDFAAFRGETPDELTGWLASALRHNLMDLLRSRGHRQRARGRELPLEGCEGVGDLMYQLADSRPGPEELALYLEQKEATRQALQRLPERAQLAIRLRYDERLPYAEVGARMGCSAAAVRKLCTRALRAFRITHCHNP
jgi:RNA polymerase sigma-70 factor (ECF subfamily)